MSVMASDVFNAMLYGQQSQESATRFKEAAKRVAQYLPQQFQRVQQVVYDNASRLADVDYRHSLKVATAHLESTWNGDYIRAMKSIAELQASSLTNARWNMAEPTYRDLYHKGQANGYGGDYVDVQPNAIGNDHVDYRRVTHGVWIESEDEDMSTMTVYDTDVSNDENEEDQLTLQQQVDIMSNWVKIREETTKRRLDIGCPFGGSL